MTCYIKEEMNKKLQKKLFIDFMDLNEKQKAIEKENTNSNKIMRRCDPLFIIEQINLDKAYHSSRDIESNIDPNKHNDRHNVKITSEVDGLSDLMKLLDENPLLSNVTYNINLKAIHNIKDELIKLNSMVGMRSLKDNIVEQILYFVQGLHNFTDSNESILFTEN